MWLRPSSEEHQNARLSSACVRTPIRPHSCLTLETVLRKPLPSIPSCPMTTCRYSSMTVTRGKMKPGLWELQYLLYLERFGPKIGTSAQRTELIDLTQALWCGKESPTPYTQTLTLGVAIWLPLWIAVFYCWAVDLVVLQTALRSVESIDILMVHPDWDSTVEKKWTAQTHR